MASLEWRSSFDDSVLVELIQSFGRLACHTLVNIGVDFVDFRIAVTGEPHGKVFTDACNHQIGSESTPEIIEPEPDDAGNVTGRVPGALEAADFWKNHLIEISISGLPESLQLIIETLCHANGARSRFVSIAVRRRSNDFLIPVDTVPGQFLQCREPETIVARRDDVGPQMRTTTMLTRGEYLQESAFDRAIPRQI